MESTEAQPEEQPVDKEAVLVHDRAFMRHANKLAMKMVRRESIGSPRSIGRAFREDIGAESNPVKDVAVGFILIAVALVIALTILPVITAAVATAQADGNISAADGTLLGLLPTMLIVGLVGGAVAFLFRAFKSLRA